MECLLLRPNCRYYVNRVPVALLSFDLRVVTGAVMVLVDPEVLFLGVERPGTAHF